MIRAEFIVERNGRQFVLFGGLLDLAHNQGLKAIRTQLLQVPSEDNGQTAIVSAEVETERGTFCGIGDASPSNVSRAMLTCTIRLAETRSKARALRDAVNVGIAAFEELGVDDDRDDGPWPRAASSAPLTDSESSTIDLTPATSSQRVAVARLAQATGVVVDVDSLTRLRAGELIRELQRAKPN